MSASLQDKVVIITGAASGIGASAAEAFARAGARVALGDPLTERLKALAEKLGGPDRALPVTMDVTQTEDCDRLVRLATQQFGRVDMLVNNAAVGHWARFSELKEAETRRFVEVNVIGVMNMTHAVLPGMRRRRHGVIINVASVMAHMGTPMQSAYCATKFAVRGFSQSLRMELAGDGIEVVCFCPGHTDTDFYAHAVVRGALWDPCIQKPMSSAEVARRLVAVAIHPRSEVLLTAEGRFMAVAHRFLPRLTLWGTRRFFERADKARANVSTPRLHGWHWSRNGLLRK